MAGRTVRWCLNPPSDRISFHFLFLISLMTNYRLSYGVLRLRPVRSLCREHRADLPPRAHEPRSCRVEYGEGRALVIVGRLEWGVSSVGVRSTEYLSTLTPSRYLPKVATKVRSKQCTPYNHRGLHALVTPPDRQAPPPGLIEPDGVRAERAYHRRGLPRF